MDKHQKALLNESITITSKLTNSFTDNCKSTTLAMILSANSKLNTIPENIDKELAVKSSIISIDRLTLTNSPTLIKTSEFPETSETPIEDQFFSDFNIDLSDPIDPTTIEYDEDSLSDLYYSIGESNRHHLLPTHLY